MEQKTLTKPILRLDRVCYQYRNKYQSVDAVKTASAEFFEGKTYAIIGKSGSGKSTLLSLIAGLALPTDGQVLYRGVPTDDFDLDKYRRNNVAVVYQSFNLFPLMTCLENVCFPLELLGKTPKEAAVIAREYIAHVNLPETVWRRFPNMISGGEKQRVAIARALASGAKIILADEPTGNLDVANGEKIVQLLSDLAHEDNYTVIIVTHDMSITQVVDEVMQMSDGYLLPLVGESCE
ncbi:MAG: ABC transporter ATP-binding protein [Anaerolineaceae bacterium]|nr:ABC transporter ATP-binding protein [Anaerolineaceae bacterium]MDD4042519.1 ABC transporter ATP-binding protein [Anaerolineaceae bacterium]MDD4578726.1 ABC transporter ATP-binding protein [Anaerolineaceae bacterium]